MALTAAQQTKVTELKAIIADFKSTYMNSPSMMSMYGSYMFDLEAKITKKITEIEGA